MLVYRNPRTSFTHFHSIFDDIFENKATNSSDNETICPIYDVIENDTEFLVSLSLPGIVKEDSSVNVEKNKLIVKAERKHNADNKYNRKEIYYGKYKESFNLPESVDRENISAEFTNGILSIKLPKILDEKLLGKKTIQIS